MNELDVAHALAFAALCGAAVGVLLYALLEHLRERAERQRWGRGDSEWSTVVRLRRRV